MENPRINQSVSQSDSQEGFSCAGAESRPVSQSARQPVGGTLTQLFAPRSASLCVSVSSAAGAECSVLTVIRPTSAAAHTQTPILQTLHRLLKENTAF